MPEQQVIARLDRHELHQPESFGAPKCASDPPRAPIGYADVSGAAAAHDGFERLERLVERRGGIVSVQLEQVHVIGTEPGKRRIDGAQEMFARRAGVPWQWAHRAAGLCRDDEAFAAALQPFADDLLCVPFSLVGRVTRVSIRRVDEIDARISGGIEDRHRLCFVGIGSKGHCAKAQARDSQPGVAKTDQIATAHGL
ncbi:hypothetical protein D3C71_1348080 [compost metagenome]